MRWQFSQENKGIKVSLLFFMAVLCIFSPARANSASPNVVFIVLDTLRADRVSFNGYERATTPNLERLARDSVIYTRAHSVAPWTLPSHMSMFTGMFPSEHGATWRAFSEPEDMKLKDLFSRSFSLSNPSQLLTVQLKQLGYRTAAFSSNAWVAERTGFGEGFDAFYEMWQQDDGYRKVFKWVPPGLREHKYFLNEYNSLSEMEVGDAGLVLRGLRMHTNAEGELKKPFFLFFNFIDPHYPYSPPMSWRYLYGDDHILGERIANFEFSELAMQAGDQSLDVKRLSPFYDAEINYVDAALGRLLEILRQQNIYNESLIIVTSDHGEHLGENGHFSHQFSMEEELLHVPLLIKYPGNTSGGTKVDNPLVSNIDVYETILSSADLSRRNSPAPTHSLDLGDMDRFTREFLIAEYDYSVPYLRISHEANEDFSVEAHSVVRRVVYDAYTRYEFANADRLAITPIDDNSADSAGLQRAANVLHQYLMGLSTEVLQQADTPMDAKTLERLRSLGYVD